MLAHVGLGRSLAWSAGVDESYPNHGQTGSRVAEVFGLQ